jgi:DNA invertase Pin-like site-specific DNA recombinase
LGQVATYCRVSTDDQSCERQERDPRAFARPPAAVFKEMEPTNDRPERKKVIAPAQQVSATFFDEHMQQFYLQGIIFSPSG